MRRENDDYGYSSTTIFLFSTQFWGPLELFFVILASFHLPATIVERPLDVTWIVDFSVRSLPILGLGPPLTSVHSSGPVYIPVDYFTSLLRIWPEVAITDNTVAQTH